MRVTSILRMAGLLASLSLCYVLPAAADITVLGRYTLINGDTLTRASYYSPRRSRVTAPDGKEFVYDGKSKRITFINHEKKTYWSGPITQADSIATRIMNETRKEIAKVAAVDQEA